MMGVFGIWTNKSRRGLREEKIKGFPKAWKGDDLGRLIAETKISFLKKQTTSRRRFGFCTSRSEVTGLILSLNGYRILEEREKL